MKRLLWWATAGVMAVGLLLLPVALLPSEAQANVAGANVRKGGDSMVGPLTFIRPALNSMVQCWTDQGTNSTYRWILSSGSSSGNLQLQWKAANCGAIGNYIIDINSSAGANYPVSFGSGSGVSVTGLSFRTAGQGLGSFPTCNMGLRGDLRFDTDSNILRVCDGTSWRYGFIAQQHTVVDFSGFCGGASGCPTGVRFAAAISDGAHQFVSCKAAALTTVGGSGTVTAILRNETAAADLGTLTIDNVAGSYVTDTWVSGNFTDETVLTLRRSGGSGSPEFNVSIHCYRIGD